VRPGSFAPPGAACGNEGLVAVFLSSASADHKLPCRSILGEKGGTLFEYHRLGDLKSASPAFDVDLAVFSTDGHPNDIRQAMRWFRRHWPHAMYAVIARRGGVEAELAAREAGATFFTSTLSADQWRDISRAADNSRERKAG